MSLPHPGEGSKPPHFGGHEADFDSRSGHRQIQVISLQRKLEAYNDNPCTQESGENLVAQGRCFVVAQAQLAGEAVQPGELFRGHVLVCLDE